LSELAEVVKTFLLFILFSQTAIIMADPLFESDEMIEIVVKGPFKQLNKERDKAQIYSPASLTFQNNGEPLEIPIELQVRGNRRRSGGTCSFAPLRVIVDKKVVKDTLFHKQKKLKLVAQCRPGLKLYEQYVITEYLIYKSFNLLTENSYHARLADITYVAQDGETMFRHYGFFIEANKRLAKRIDRKRWRSDVIDATRLDRRHLNLVSLFQFMIGNTDWSATHGSDNECCHNGKLFGEPEGNENLYIPYDFDMTGLVNPEYAATPVELKLDSIRERRYRGYCRNNEFLDQNITLFNEKREAITGLFESSPWLTKAASKKKISYIKKFYKLINDPKRVKRHIHGWCHESKIVVS
jgi:hypothetical protein